MLASVAWLASRSISLDLVRRDLLVVGEVEPQAVGLDQRAGLLDVAAEHLAQGMVQEVGGGVVAADRVAAGDVDARPSPTGRGSSSPSMMRARCRRRFGSANVVSSTSAVPVSVRDRADVADLAAAHGVERRAVEEDLDGGLDRSPRGRTASTRASVVSSM